MKGRLEALITVPGGGWSVSATNGIGGPTTVTLAAGTYYLSALLTAFQTQLNASRPSGWTVTGSLGESGTGLVTLNCSSTNWAIVWISTSLRDLLGFAADIPARATALTAPRQSYSLWLPDSHYYAPLDLTQEPGFLESDLRQTESPLGAVKSLEGNEKVVLEGLRWDAITNNVARNISATVTGFELWWKQTQLGKASWATVGTRFALYPNADVGTYNEYCIVGRIDSKMPQTAPGWTGRYRIELPRLVQQT